MLVSGGHSSLLRVDDVTGHDGGVAPLGSTIDDAAGEAFDKVARLLGLPFPGGPHVDRAARSGSSVAIDFPRGLTSQRDLQRHRFDFSFSGLKTAVARWVEARERAGEPVPVEDVAASFQEAVCDVLTRKAVDAAVSEGIEDILVGGGVAANSRLRALVEERAAARGIRVRVPRPGLCTDNGAMVAALGAEMVAAAGSPPRSTCPPTPRCPSPPCWPDVLDVVVPLLLLVVGAVLLTAGAEGFAENVNGAASRLGVSVIALGVLLAGAEPEEAITAMLASGQGHPALAAGDAIGANLVILTLTLGLAALVTPLRVGRRGLEYGVASAVLGAVAWLFLVNGVLGRLEGFVLVLLYVAGVVWVWRREKAPPLIGEMAELDEKSRATATRTDEATGRHSCWCSPASSGWSSAARWRSAARRGWSASSGSASR